MKKNIFILIIVETEYFITQSLIGTKL